MVLNCLISIFIQFAKISANCGFQDFQSAQLDNKAFYQVMNLQSASFYSFGVWTMYAPLRYNSFSSNSTSYYNQAQPIDGFHILNFKVGNSIQLIYYLKSVIQTIYPTHVILQNTQKGIYSYQFQYHPFYFEGYWVFTYFCFNSKNYINFASYNIGEDGFFNFYFTNKRLVTLNLVSSLEYGGDGQLSIGNKNLNFFKYLGRISVITIFQEEHYFNNNEKQAFLQYIQSCQIPTACPNANEIQVFNDVFNFQNISNRQYQLDLPGLRFYLEFWIKRSLEQTTSAYEFIFSYGASFYNQGFQKRILVFARRENHTIVLLHEIYAFYYFPSEVDSDYLLQYQVKLNAPEEIIQEWVFFRYEFHRVNVYENIYLNIYASYNDVRTTYVLFSYPYYFQYSNYQNFLTLFSEIAEFDTDSYMPFQGHLANFRIYYCYSGDQLFGKESGFNCHKKCKTCEGPTEFDCDSCFFEQFRYLEIHLKQCLCNFGYKDVGNLICQEQQKVQSGIYFNSTKQQNICDFGYFEFWLNEIFQKCIKCPYFDEPVSQFQCINCLNNQKSWYKNPVCDQIIITEDGLNYQNFTLPQTELFYINNNLLTIELCFGCAKQVESYQDNTVIVNLSPPLFFKCKLNMRVQNNTCLECEQYCQICSLNNSCLQCIEGYYLAENYNCFQCPQGCTQCTFDKIQMKIICTSCNTGFAYFEDQCLQCGPYCQQCEITLNQINFEQYLKCTECEINKFISLDGESCYQNNLDYCSQPFQYSIIDILQNTNFFNFQPIEKQYIQTGCLQCQSHTYLQLTTFQCVPLSFEKSMKGCYQSVQIDDQIYCTLGIGSITLLTIGYCSSFLSQCKYCLPYDIEYLGHCQLCEDGYYNDYYSSFCQKCPDIGCTKCYQSDYSKLIKSQYSMIFVISGSLGIIDYKILTQTKDDKYVKIFCIECAEGYMLFEDKCILNCPSNCQTCKVINFQNQCISCLILDEYSRNQIIDGQCVKCPKNCEFCFPREQEEKFQINPFFNNEQFQYYANSCIKPSQQNLFFDPEIKQFIDCLTNLECQKEIQFDIFVDCTNKNKETIQNNQLFRSLKNIFDFSVYENEDYYKYLNDELIKKITFYYHIQENTQCIIEDDLIFSTQLQINVFNLKDIFIIFDGQNSTIKLEKSVFFNNISNLEVKNVTFQLFQGSLQSQSIVSYSISLHNIKIFQIQALSQEYQGFISIIEASQIMITELDIFGLTIPSESSLISFVNQKNQCKIDIEQFSITETHFEQNSILNFNQFYAFELTIKKLSFKNNNFFNTSLLAGNYQQFYFTLSYFDVQNSSINNCFDFIDLQNSLMSNLEEVLIEKTNLSNSIFFRISNNCTIINLNLNSLFINDLSYFILKNQQSSNFQLVELNFVSFVNIYYSEKSRLITIINQSGMFVVRMVNCLFQNLSIQKTLIENETFFQKSSNETMIYLEGTQFQLINSRIIKGVGVPEITIKNCTKVIIENSYFTLHEVYQFKSLQVKTDCFQHFVSPNYYDSIIIIEELQELQLVNNIFESLIIFDSALIKLKQSFNLSLGRVLLQNNTFQYIILHQQYYYTQISLLLINSIIPITFTFINNTYNNNLFNIKSDNLKNKQGLLFTLESSSSILVLDNNIIVSNMMISNTSSLLFADCLSLTLTNTLFSNNSFFSYDTVRRFIYWNFVGNITIQQLEKYFPQNHEGGNGLIQCQVLNITNITILNSKAKNGGGMKIDLINDGIIEIRNSFFENLEANLLEQSQGGFLHVASSSNQLILKIINCNFKQIKSRLKGAIIYIKQPASHTQIILENTAFVNINSLQGSIFYQEKSTQNEQVTNLSMVNCSFLLEKQSLFLFFNELGQIFTYDINNFINAFTLIYCNNCNIKIQDIQFYDTPLIQLFDFSGETNIKNMEIINSIFIKRLIRFKQENRNILMQNVTIINCSQLQQSSFFDQMQESNLNKSNQQTVNIQCQTDVKAPQQLFDQVNDISNINSITLIQSSLQTAQNATDNSLIQFQNLNSQLPIAIKIHQIQFDYIICQMCSSGILDFYFLYNCNLTVNYLHISNSQCGKNGCISFISPEQEKIKTIQELMDKNTKLVQYLMCLKNTAEQGGCLYIQNDFVQLNFSTIKQNNASKGGGIFITGNQAGIISQDLVILENSANTGGGIYSEVQFIRSEFGVYLAQNQAVNFSNSIFQPPEKLGLKWLNQTSIVIPQTITSQTQFQIDSILTANKSNAILQVPTGEQLRSYKQFDLSQNRFDEQKFIFQLLPLNSLNEHLLFLEDSYCILDLFYQNESTISRKNLLGLKKIYFDTVTNSYNLENQTFFLSQRINLYILEVQCNLVKIPIKTKGVVYDYHSNYSLQIIISPRMCQLGEFSASIDDYCHECNIELNQYSVTQNATVCQVVNEEMIVNFTSSQISLRNGYWRENITSSTIEICKNKMSNCEGGWNFGNDLCKQGHICALCEQCDYYNIRGQGSYFRTNQQECYLCTQELNFPSNFIITILIFMLLFFIFYKLSIKNQEQIRKTLLIPKLKHINVIYQSHEISLIQMIKISIQYFQIISIIQEFKVTLITDFLQLTNCIGNPFEQLKIFQSCQLINYSIDILYIDIVQQFSSFLTILTGFTVVILFLHLFKKIKIDKAKLFNFLYLCYFYIIISAQQQIAKQLGFRFVSNQFYIYYNICYKYMSSIHFQLAFAVYMPIFIAIGFAIPSFLYFKLFYFEKIKTITSRKTFGLWFSSYSLNRQCWEIYKFTLYSAIIVFIIILDLNYSIKIILIYSILLLFRQVSYEAKIFFNRKVISLEQSLLFLCMLILCCAYFSFDLENQISSSVQQIQSVKIIVYYLSNNFFIIGIVLILLQIFSYYFFNYQQFLHIVIKAICENCKIPFIETYKQQYSQNYIDDRKMRLLQAKQSLKLKWKSISLKSHIIHEENNKQQQ